MTSSELVPTVGSGRATAVRRRRRAEPDIVSAVGERISASAARKLTNAVPRSSRNARASRWRSYALWCATYDWAEDEPNAVLSCLGDRGHPANSIEAHFSTLRAIQGEPLSDKEVKACQPRIRG
ncbi:hypothetical protein ABZ725_51020 [Streptomyces sp. NPDC006872]|uniref:hypothetical protein n=1 Tax=Streptomyces sp. NPDC006872 TaxID=3155720 RepID=UPI0033DC19FD